MELTTKLGTTATILLDGGINTDSAGQVSKLASFGTGTAFLLKMNENAYLKIPLAAFQEAILQRDGLHAVTLTNAVVVTGKLVGQVTVEGRVYDLSSAVTLRMATKGDPGKAPAHKKMWKLTERLAQLEVPGIADPEFTYLYTGQTKVPAGFNTYTLEGYVASTHTQVFTIRVGAEEIVASLSDFAGVSAQSGKNSPSNIKLVAANGTETTGQLLLKNGVAPPSTNDWGIVGYVPEWADSWLLLLNPNFMLSSK